ncbi:MAG: LysM peptidoglycan-binding domain-containing protein [Chloroflexota bacterium]|nr:LysM peptidoglycan-binding domain-containing protein [Chloroflexota bacterium]
MRLGRVAIVVVCSMSLAGALASACGGGSSRATAVDLSKVPTATLPASLPEPKIIGGGAAQPGGGSSYTVKAGDTLAGIASRFGVSLEDLQAANPNINGAALSIGQSVRLPAVTDVAAPAATRTPATPVPAAATDVPATATEPAPASTPVPAATATAVSVGQTYTVVGGDIPETIAAKFGITIDELLAANPTLNPTSMHIGDVLVIPPKRDG